MRTTLLVAGALLVAVSANAASIKLYNTGVDDSGNPLAGGAVDPHYFSTDYNAQAEVLSDGNTWYLWVKPADAKWIAPKDLWIQNPTGDYTITTTFDLTGLDPTTAQISGQWAADQWGTMFLNGNAVASLGNGNWDSHLSDFSITQYFKPGINTLSFVVNYPDGADGLIVSGIQGTADAVPEPCSVLALGLGALALIRRRRA